MTVCIIRAYTMNDQFQLLCAPIFQLLIGLSRGLVVVWSLQKSECQRYKLEKVNCIIRGLYVGHMVYVLCVLCILYILCVMWYIQYCMYCIYHMPIHEHGSISKALVSMFKLSSEAYSIVHCPKWIMPPVLSLIESLSIKAINELIWGTDVCTLYWLIAKVYFLFI